jgi:hypothetical protein
MCTSLSGILFILSDIIYIGHISSVSIHTNVYMNHHTCHCILDNKDVTC